MAFIGTSPPVLDARVIEGPETNQRSSLQDGHGRRSGKSLAVARSVRYKSGVLRPELFNASRPAAVDGELDRARVLPGEEPQVVDPFLV